MTSFLQFYSEVYESEIGGRYMVPVSEIRTGLVCAHQFEDRGEYCRAEIKKYEDDRYTVCFCLIKIMI